MTHMRQLREFGLPTLAIAAVCGRTPYAVAQAIGRSPFRAPRVPTPTERWLYRKGTTVLIRGSRLMGEVVDTLTGPDGRLLVRVRTEGGDVLPEYAEPDLVEIIRSRPL